MLHSAVADVRLLCIMYKENLIKHIMQLRNLEYVDQRVAQKFLDFINGNQNYFRDNNPDRHICSFFLPYDEKRKLIYLGHHKKAKDWIPPGGHINQGENPLNTVYREFRSEERRVGKECRSRWSPYH